MDNKFKKLKNAISVLDEVILHYARLGIDAHVLCSAALDIEAWCREHFDSRGMPLPNSPAPSLSISHTFQNAQKDEAGDGLSGEGRGETGGEFHGTNKEDENKKESGTK